MYQNQISGKTNENSNATHLSKITFEIISSNHKRDIMGFWNLPQNPI